MKIPLILSIHRVPHDILYEVTLEHDEHLDREKHAVRAPISRIFADKATVEDLEYCTACLRQLLCSLCDCDDRKSRSYYLHSPTDPGRVFSTEDNGEGP